MNGIGLARCQLQLQVLTTKSEASTMQNTRLISGKFMGLALGLLWAVCGLLGCGALDPPQIATHDQAALAEQDMDDELPAEVAETSKFPLEASQTPSNDSSREEALLAALTIFALAVFVGFEVISKVPPTLHTPLMSGSNAISGITLVGAVLMASCGGSRWAMFLGFLAVVLATINAVGGFMVTDRMLSMFKRK